jgi:hypothetical protein
LIQTIGIRLTVIHVINHVSLYCRIAFALHFVKLLKPLRMVVSASFSSAGFVFDVADVRHSFCCPTDTILMLAQRQESKSQALMA